MLMEVTSGEVVGEFHQYVQPQENTQLSSFCKELTGITQVSRERFYVCHVEGDVYVCVCVCVCVCVRERDTCSQHHMYSSTSCIQMTYHFNISAVSVVHATSTTSYSSTHSVHNVQTQDCQHMSGSQLFGNGPHLLLKKKKKHYKKGTTKLKLVKCS